MRKLLTLLLAFLTLTGCKLRKSASQERKEGAKEHFTSYKDSSLLLVHQGRTSAVAELSATSFELELESLTDSAGNPQELTYYRIHDGDNEVIRVRNGRVKIKATNTHSKSLQQADTALTISNAITTKTEAQKHAITQTKQVKSSPVRHAL